MSKNARAGGKFSGSHTTLIPLAAKVCDLVAKCPRVQKIAPGFIKAGLKSVSGKKRVKISLTETAVKLQFRDNTTQQEVFVYADDASEVVTAVKQGQGKKQQAYDVTVAL